MRSKRRVSRRRVSKRRVSKSRRRRVSNRSRRVYNKRNSKKSKRRVHNKNNYSGGARAMEEEEEGDMRGKVRARAVPFDFSGAALPLAKRLREKEAAKKLREKEAAKKLREEEAAKKLREEEAAKKKEEEEALSLALAEQAERIKKKKEKKRERKSILKTLTASGFIRSLANYSLSQLSELEILLCDLLTKARGAHQHATPSADAVLHKPLVPAWTIPALLPGQEAQVQAAWMGMGMEPEPPVRATRQEAQAQAAMGMGMGMGMEEGTTINYRLYSARGMEAHRVGTIGNPRSGGEWEIIKDGVAEEVEEEAYAKVGEELVSAEGKVVGEWWQGERVFVRSE